jgi:ADP-ribose pyrophosphatase YjhB (NUDIX family)
MNTNKRFNIRVYGILMNENQQILVSDELIKGMQITKFPGGGLEFGEGTIECVKREFLEETNNQVEVVNHFYTTDYFQISAFNQNDQIISIYYLLRPLDNFTLDTTTKKFDFDLSKKFDQKFRWIALQEINELEFTLPIDKKVAALVKNNKVSIAPHS